MENKEIFERLKRIGLNVAYGSTEKKEEQLPYLRYAHEETKNFYADNEIFFSVKTIEVELYTKKKDEKLENKVENELKKIGPYTKAEEYDNEEDITIIIYKIEVR